MTALEKMRETFEMCTVMAGVEPDFECIYITKAAADALLDETEAENAKLRELLDYITPIAWHAASENERDRMYELGVEA